MTLTELQQKKLKKLFDAYDFDSSQSLAKSDFQSYIEDLNTKLGYQKESDDYQTVESVFWDFWNGLHQKAGLTQDGEVKLEAWLSYFDYVLLDENFQSAGIDANVDLLFNIIDQDKDGNISLKEYTDLLKSYRISDSEASEVFSKLDINGDGSLSREELKQLYKEFYYSDDPNARGNAVLGLVA
ncbi:EF-hand domain-containing protein [Planktothrix paucivesiculata]|uniref:Calerythrin n=1 Tax=Planktothrix paucivesiculata PCC 9631 TaxID=671071 RepID=A0A0K0PEI9_9CYAN|nr:EF-hand domain-containing protein [Planktothrix paucivesiculata]AKQ22679.1 calerythrin [Planktothrix paucivesiculata PCC 9631]VXD25131.1 putative EF hand proteiin [Planktothrix paucivesiculata PCC 9631]